MEEIHFGVMKGKFFEEKGELKFQLLSIYGEGSVVIRVNVRSCEVLESSSERLLFKSGWRTFDFNFNFSEFTPGINKISLMIRLFGKIPFYRFNGEVGETYKNQFIAMFNVSNQ